MWYAFMENESDLSRSVKDLGTRTLKKQITIRLEKETIDDFKQMAAETDIPWRKLIRMFLRDCAEKELRPHVDWR